MLLVVVKQSELSGEAEKMFGHCVQMSDKVELSDQCKVRRVDVSQTLE